MKRLFFILLLIPFLNSCETKIKYQATPAASGDSQFIMEGLLIGEALQAFSKKEYSRSIAMADSALRTNLSNSARVIALKVRGKSKWALKDKKGACLDWQDASMYNENPNPSSEEEQLISQYCQTH